MRSGTENLYSTTINFIFILFYQVLKNSIFTELSNWLSFFKLRYNSEFIKKDICFIVHGHFYNSRLAFDY